MSINRFIPSICAGIVLFGCVVPSQTNLLALPLSFRWTDPPSTGQIADVLKTVMASSGMEQAKPGLMTAQAIAYFAYIVPVTAFLIIIANLRGFVPKGAQILAGSTWLACGIGVPLIALTIGLDAMKAMPMVAMLGSAGQVSAWQVLSYDIGAWIIAIGASAMLLSSIGLLTYRETSRVEPQRMDEA